MAQIRNVSSEIPEVTVEEVKFMVSLVADAVARPGVKGEFKGGVVVPTLLNFPLLDPVVSLRPDGLYRLAADFCHPEDCEELRAALVTTTTPASAIDALYDYDEY